MVTTWSSHALASAWECIEKSDKHVYRASQSVPGDDCKQISVEQPQETAKEVETKFVDRKQKYRKLVELSAAAARRYAREPLAQDAQSLPRNFLGHNCIAIANMLNERMPVRDEFETSASYSLRIESLKQALLYGSIRVSDLLAFVPIASSIESRYDADTEVMTVSLTPGQYQYIRVDTPSETAVLAQLKTESRAYTGANGFGRTARVTSSGYQVCAIAGMPESAYFLGGRSTEIRFPIDTTSAKSMKPNIAAAYVGRITYPFISDYHAYTTPTIDAPYEDYAGGMTIPLKIDQIWIFDKLSGRILYKAGDSPSN